MLVRVVLLRERGRRLTPTEIRQRPEYVGMIEFGPAYGKRAGPWVANLKVDDGRVLVLQRAQLIKWTARGLVLRGIEHREQYRELLAERQAWWCRPESGGGAGGPSMGRLREHLVALV